VINRRSTPSGDGRGRGRAGGSGRGGRPAFRPDDSRGRDRRDDFRDGPRRDERGGSYRDERGPRRDERGGSYRDERGSRRDDFRRDGRGGSSSYRGDERGSRRDDFRGDRRGYRDDRGGSRRDDFRRDERGGSRRDDHRSSDFRSGDRRGSRDDRYDRDGLRADRGGYRARYGRDSGRYERPDRDDLPYSGGDDIEYESYTRSTREDSGSFRVNRSGRREGSSPIRARYGKRADDRQDGRHDENDRRQDGRHDENDRRQDSRAARPPRRDTVRTIGDSRRGADRRPQAGARPEDRFKTARQPIRDRDFYPEGYTDERDTTEVPDGIRLQKVLAQAGVASRRACEEMIGEGRVTVDGQVVRRFGAKVDPTRQVIHVDGKRIPTAPDLVYYALNKPIGVVSTMDDPQGRPCLADYVEDLAPRLFHVGRLDTETEGLLLLTNDGELANRLTHPSYGVPKKYWAKVPGPIPRDLGRRLKEGIALEDGIARADSFQVIQEHGQQALVEVVLHEGRKHVVRRMLEEAGHRVIDLARIEFGPIKLGRTKPGTIRALTLREVGELYAAVKL
jgi:23S rRNA pseudouridine2605 synthase